MDSTEKHVLKHLHTRNFNSIEYEPDGNVPPDFIADEKIAIEVRLLNQNHFTHNATKGLEETSIPLWQKTKKIVEGFSSSQTEDSWFVNLKFSRPVPSWKKLKLLLVTSLEQFRDSPVKGPMILVKEQGFELEVFCKTSTSHSTMFVMGGSNDLDSEGWVLAEMGKNINYCASEKTKKIINFKNNYSEWWLVLVDHIGYGLDDIGKEQFHENISIDHSWNKIIIIDPLDENNWFEI